MNTIKKIEVSATIKSNNLIKIKHYDEVVEGLCISCDIDMSILEQHIRAIAGLPQSTTVDITDVRIK